MKEQGRGARPLQLPFFARNRYEWILCVVLSVICNALFVTKRGRLRIS